MRVRLAVLFAPLCCAALVAADSRAAEPQTEDQKTVYAIGYATAQRLEPFALTPEEVEVLISGLRDGATGKASAITMDVYGPKINAFGQARSAKVASAEKEAGAAFLTSEAAADGATPPDAAKHASAVLGQDLGRAIAIRARDVHAPNLGLRAFAALGLWRPRSGPNSTWGGFYPQAHPQSPQRVSCAWLRVSFQVEWSVTSPDVVYE